MIANAAELLASFLTTMSASGVTPADSGALAAELASGRLVRFRCIDERKPNGWAVLFLDRSPAGAFGNWRLGFSETWRAGSHTSAPYSGHDLDRVRAIREASRMARQQDVASEAAKVWNAARVANPDHPYLAAKHMAGGELRQSGRMLLVPMRDVGGRLWNLQQIHVDGSKRFLKGGRVAGLLWRRGELSDAASELVIGEGVATMAAVHAATGLPVAAAFSANNLTTVTRSLATKHRALILAADTDLNKTGQRAAREAASALGAGIAHPPRPPGWPEGRGWDFADAWPLPGGADAIRCAFSGLMKLQKAEES